MQRKFIIVLSILILFIFFSGINVHCENIKGESGNTAPQLSVIKGVLTLARTGQTISYADKDDGFFQKGAEWPVPRFTDNGDGTITDNLTGLVWSRFGDSPGPDTCNPWAYKTWVEALQHIKCLNTNKYKGYSDWRLPNVLEMESLYNVEKAENFAWLNSQGFVSALDRFYWTSTTDANSPYKAWIVYMRTGNVISRSKKRRYFIWPVRAGNVMLHSSWPAALYKTGQTSCYDRNRQDRTCKYSGQDGELQKGVSWPAPRFTVTGQCIVDNLTGLMWAKQPDDAKRKWTNALLFTETVDLCGFTDWRLPNRKELLSLVNYGVRNQSEWLNAQGFENIKEKDYWTSSAYVGRPGNAWVINMKYGHVVAGMKRKQYYVLPVRSTY